MVKNHTQQMQCGDHRIDLQNETIIMGILNVTPDSFSDGGQFDKLELAVRHAKQMVNDGAHIIDIGGESTRQGSERVSLEDELARVIPVVEAVANNVNVPISIDTYKSEVAEEAIKAGATIINDIWGAKEDPRIAQVAAKYELPIILMHNRHDRNYKSFYRDVVNDIFESIAIAKEAGLSDDKIIIDPGIGFAKDHRENIEMMHNLDKFAAIGYPVLLGTSRKSMIGNILKTEADDRLEGTIATVCYGIQKGCQIVRVHDVKEVKKAVKVIDELMGVSEGYYG